MRILAIILVWLSLGAFYWWMNEASTMDCCDDVLVQTAVDSPAVKVVKWPVEFNHSKWRPLLSKQFATYRDSILNSVSDDEILEIYGIYSMDEANTSSFENLGVARAEAMKYIFAKGFDKSRMVAHGKIRQATDGDEKQWISYNIEKVETRIQEIESRTLIYFPNNSNRGMIDDEVETYLEQVAERVLLSGEKISLVGHSDSFGKATYNHRLGLHRAYAIRRILVLNGVAINDISVESKGETDPIATNSTEDGRSKNRRVELVIHL